MQNKIAAFSYSFDELSEVVRQFWKVAAGFNIITFSGEMGAGKTTFIHYLCEYLNVEDAVSSPTFSLINEYHFVDKNKGKTIFHIDLYRLNSIPEAINAGIEDCLLSAKAAQNYAFIEWPEKAETLIPKPYLHVVISSISHTERKMELYSV